MPVTTKLCLSWQIFVATKVLLRQTYFWRNKSYVATNILLSRQAYFCCDKRRVLSWQTRVCSDKLLLLNYELFVSMLLYRLCPQRLYGLLGAGSPGRPPRLSHSSWTMSMSSSFQCCFTSTETVRTVRDVEPRTATSSLYTAPELCSLMLLYVHRDRMDYYFIRDGEPRTPTSTVTQLLSSSFHSFFTVHWDSTDY